jgi:anti-sigma-K factor RskA
MKDLDEEQRLIRQYLLGDLEEAPREAVEQRMITDRGYLEEVKAVERDLMDEYVSGALTGRDRVKFQVEFAFNPRTDPKIEIRQSLSKTC